ncbi:MAG: DUF1592 domain-containing protein [Planctomycetaceae bacterium]
MTQERPPAVSVFYRTSTGANVLIPCKNNKSTSNRMFASPAAVLVWIGIVLCPGGQAVVSASPVIADDYQAQIRPLLQKYCFECHGNDAAEGNLSLEEFSSDSEAASQPEAWWNVLRNVRAQVMPPVGSEKPTTDEIRLLTDWIKQTAFQIDLANPDPGRRTVRRLNREEYGNTVSDLMGIRFNAAILFPPDDSGFGFDNVGDALSFSPLLMEKYLKAAQQIVAEAVPTQTWVLPSKKLNGREFRDKDRNFDGHGLSGKQPAHVERTITITEPGRYIIDTAVRLNGTFEFDSARYQVVFRVDDRELSRREYAWDENKLHTDHFEETWDEGDRVLSYEIIPLKAEESPDDVEQNRSGNVWFDVETVRIEGPQDTPERVHPENYLRFFTRDQPPAAVYPGARREYAREIIGRFTQRAFRSRIESETVDRLVGIAEESWLQPESTFESGIAQAMVAALASPRFLFRLENPMEEQKDQPVAMIDEPGLASRLSYFLWSTMPDRELVELAEQQQLRSALRPQVERMMSDSRAREFIRNFVGQWLRMRDVRQTTVDPVVVLGFQEEYEQLLSEFRSRRSRGFNRELTPEEEKARSRFREIRNAVDQFDDELRRAMQQETEMCVEYIAKNDGSLPDLLDSNYTFVNEKLARHYGLPDVQGNEMRRVLLPEDSPRGGIVSHASMLLLTSNPTRTSPVKRGLYVLDNLLGTPSPPAPPNVPALESAADRFGDHKPSLRELLSAHREDALCSSCHSRMDPLGLALENFDALGRWREEESTGEIDASGRLITGEEFQDVRELKRILREFHAEDFYRCVSQKMLTFAIGRGLDYTDEETVDQIVARLKANNGRFSELVFGVIESAPFQKMRNSRPEKVSRL